MISDCRSREFLWQEGHTAFATKAEADAEVYEAQHLNFDLSTFDSWRSIHRN